MANYGQPLRSLAGKTRCIGASGTEFCAFLRRFSGKREKDQVSIGSGWWQWIQQASARIPSTVRSYFPLSNLERWIGPAQVTSHLFPRLAHADGFPFSRSARRRSVRAACGSAAGALAGRLRRRARPHAVARRARAGLPASPRTAAARTSRVSRESSRRAL
jgi:hypothetical protein